jgi:transcriptional regulator with XRE-family HTH domain
LTVVQRAWERVDVTQRRERWSSATQTVAAQVRELRQRRGWSAEDLARECERLGAPDLNRSVLANLESGRRKYITADEVLTLAYALDVAPVHLLVPIDRRDDLDADRYRVAPDVFLSPAATRAWIRGTFCPPGRDPRRYFGNVPADEYQPPTPGMREASESLAALEDAERQLFDSGLPVDRPPATE